MKSMLRRGRVVVAVLVGVALAGCESGDSFAPPQPTEAPRSFEAFEADVLAQAEASGIEVDALPAERPELSMSMAGGDWVFVQGSVGDEAVEAVIGSSGGVLNLGPHWLMVPRNAVRGSVLFRMTPVGDGTFHVDLTASSVDNRGRIGSENDIGRVGFRRAVFLGFFYGDAPVDPASLSVAWLQSSGNVVTQPTYIFQDQNGGEWAVGALRHFSGYILVAN